jgi:mRNA-degrading endonuclease RelE of RelBE toxin-antitoxin system
VTAYALEITVHTQAAIQNLPAKDRSVIQDAIRIIQAMPHRDGTRLTDDLAGYRRLKKGRYRVFYDIDEGRRVIRILHIGFRKEGDRRDAYREFQRLIGR